jgi:hypothetical protein
MRNHLHRLAARVIGGTAARLHPMIGSIYAPLSASAVSESAAARLQPMIGSIYAPLATSAVSESAENTAFSSIRAPASGPMAKASHAGEPPTEIARAPAAWQATPETLLPFRADVGFEPPKVFAHRQDGAAEPRAEGGTANAGVPGDRPRPQLATGQTLLAAVPSAPLRPAAVRSAPERAQRGARREPDEVHIHIGRIEVTAAPPAPRPVAAPAARKAMSLDEYLARNGGRRG